MQSPAALQLLKRDSRPRGCCHQGSELWYPVSGLIVGFMTFSNDRSWRNSRFPRSAGKRRQRDGVGNRFSRVGYAIVQAAQERSNASIRPMFARKQRPASGWSQQMRRSGRRTAAKSTLPAATLKRAVTDADDESIPRLAAAIFGGWCRPVAIAPAQARPCASNL